MVSRAQDWFDQGQRDLEPNGFDDGKPADYYTAADSAQAIGCAEALLRFCADRLA
jgi:hypothetical protein